MSANAPRLPWSLDPLIAEAKRRARRRRWLILAALVIAAAAVAATLELRPASGSAAQGSRGRPVIHVVMESFPTTVYYDLKTGRETRATSFEQMWFDRRPNGLHHIVSTEGARPVTDQVWRARYGPTTQAAAVDRFYRSLTVDYRTALLSGRVKLVGRGTFDGHPVDWLRVTQRRDHRWFVMWELGNVGVDARTYKPILLRGHSGKRYVYTRILQARAVPYNAADFKRTGAPRQLPAVPEQFAPGYDFGSTNRSASRSTVVRAPWLTAGTTVAGLRLRAATPFTIRKTKHSFSYGAPRPKAMHGLALVYGSSPDLPTPVNVYGRPRDARAAMRSTIVYELPLAPRTVPWTSVPAGSVEVQTGYTTVGNHIVRTPWIGYPKRPGLYITISTPGGPHTLLQIARSLRAGK